MRPRPVAIVFGLVAAATAYIITVNAIGEGWKYLFIPSGVAAFGWMQLCWDKLKCAERRSFWKGGICGVMAVLLSYPTMWWLAILGNWLFGVKSSLGDEAVSPFSMAGIQAVWIFSLVGVVLTGALTLPVGFFLGGFFGRGRANAQLDLANTQVHR